MNTNSTFSQEVFDELGEPVRELVLDGSPLVGICGAIKSGKTTLFQELENRQPDPELKWVYWDLVRDINKSPESFWRKFEKKIGVPAGAFSKCLEASIDEVAQHLTEVLKSYLEGESYGKIVVALDNWDTAQSGDEVASGALANLIGAASDVVVDGIGALTIVGITKSPSREALLEWGRYKRAQGNPNFERLSGTIDRMGVFHEVAHLSEATAVQFAQKLGASEGQAESVADFSGGWIGLIVSADYTLLFDEDQKDRMAKTMKELVSSWVLRVAAIALDMKPVPGNITSIVNKAIHKNIELALPKHGTRFAPVVARALDAKKYLVVDSENLYMPFSNEWDKYKDDNLEYVENILADHVGNIHPGQEPQVFARKELYRFIQTIADDYVGENCSIIIIGKSKERVKKIFGDVDWKVLVSDGEHRRNQGEHVKSGVDDMIGTAFLTSTHTEEPTSELFVICSDKDWQQTLFQLKIPNLTFFCPFEKSGLKPPPELNWVRHQYMISKISPPIPLPPEKNNRKNSRETSPAKQNRMKKQVDKFLIVDTDELYEPYEINWVEFTRTSRESLSILLGRDITVVEDREQMVRTEEDNENFLVFCNGILGKFIADLAEKNNVNDEQIYLFGDAEESRRTFDFAARSDGWVPVDVKFPERQPLDIADFVVEQHTKNPHARFFIISSNPDLMCSLRDNKIPAVTFFHPFDLPEDDGYSSLNWQRHGRKILAMGFPVPPDYWTE